MMATDSRRSERFSSVGGITTYGGPAAQYVVLWEQGRPDLDAFLDRTGPLNLSALAAILRADQRECWRAGERVPAEDYLRRLPGDPADSEAAVDLIFNEFLLRERLGECPDPNEFLARFPAHGAVLRNQFDLHQAIAADTGGPSAPGSVSDTIDDTALGRRPTDGPESGSAIAGRLFGDYELLEMIARGGMGVVYKARQVSLNRVVALKMILSGRFASPEEVQRFRAEAEAAARLDHPHILPVYEVGERRGQHYFAMKLADGGSLSGIQSPESGIELRERVGILVNVARAVHFAHQRGVLHRDLKPANVLLDRAGHPYVSDFGLAKRVEGDSNLTQSGAIVGTPAYMAPEQARAERQLTTAADIYALGAILYELLTGRPPFRGDGALEVLYQVQEAEPTRPRALDPSIDRDLETICLKCLEKEPARRYGSAEALADELGRWLRGESILARPSAAWERVWKWAKRRPAVASLTAALGLVTLGGLIALAVLYRQSEDRRREAESTRAIVAQQRDSAQDQRRRTRQALNTLTDDVVERLFARQAQLGEAERRFLQKVQSFYEEFANVDGDTPEARDGRADGAQRVGLVRHRLGELAEAEASFRTAVALRSQLVADFPDVPNYRAALGESHNNLGILLQETGRLSATEVEYRAALALRAQLAAEFPSSAAYRAMLATSHNNLASLLRASGRQKEAEEAHRAGLVVREKLVADFPKVPDFANRLAGSHNNLGNLLRESGRPREAEDAFRASLAVRTKLADDYPNLAEYRADLASSHTNLGAFLRAARRHREAQDSLRAATALYSQLAADFPTVPAYRSDLVKATNNLGNLLADTDRPKEADEAYQAALAVSTRLAADFPTVPDYANLLAGTLVNLAIVARERKDFALARRWLEQAQPHHQAALQAQPRDPGFRASYRNNVSALAATLVALGDHATAAARVEELAAFDIDPGEDRYDAACSLSQCVPLAMNDPALNESRQRELAETYGRRAVELLRQAVVGGFTNIASMLKDVDLDAIRHRAEYAELLWDLADMPPADPRR